MVLAVISMLRSAIRSPGAIIGLLLCLLSFSAALIGPYVAPYSADEFVSSPFDIPSPEFLLGADTLGRDVLSRVLLGGRLILTLAAIAAVLGVVIGAFLGVAAAYSRGVIDEFIMRAVDILLAFPQTVLALLMLSFFGPRIWLVVLVVAVIHAPQVARVARSAALRVIEEDYVSYAELIGTNRLRIVITEVLPNIITPLLVEGGLRITYSIAIIAGLNFLGLGVQPPVPDWGLMINENRVGMESNPWPIVAPVALIAIMTIGINMLTDSFARLANPQGRTNVR